LCREHRLCDTFIVAMPPKKKEEAVDDALKKARFGRVSNNLKMGLVSIVALYSMNHGEPLSPTNLTSLPVDELGWPS